MPHLKLLEKYAESQCDASLYPKLGSELLPVLASQHCLLTTLFLALWLKTMIACRLTGEDLIHQLCPEDAQDGRKPAPERNYTAGQGETLTKVPALHELTGLGAIKHSKSHRATPSAASRSPSSDGAASTTSTEELVRKCSSLEATLHAYTNSDRVLRHQLWLENKSHAATRHELELEKRFQGDCAEANAKLREDFSKMQEAYAVAQQALGMEQEHHRAMMAELESAVQWCH
ncbi:hypothetical protein BDDG_06993 [Blastomyces dermatitidis ATCC 18188]|uniref:Uncharacterized protein n=1 Tax=Ajellomyces dermatitidis (strain ATCC 18188 / CBS 674.68) TaxID=653446 RepID=F2TLD5_AJEDA|nr:hypothetical protein BDDG_06993 [Blastomyces dermatitidis ATCC 18188]